MKHTMLATVVGLTVASLGANATTVIINNSDTRTATSWTYSSTSDTLRITTTTGSTPTPTPEPTPEPTPSPSPSPTPVPGECGTTPTNVEIMATFDLRNPGSQTTVNLSGSTKILSVPIKTTTNSNYAGQFQFVPTTGFGSISRQAWISPCPGTSYSATSNLCKAQGVEPTVYWKQGTSAWQCSINTNTTYYLNFKNENCGATTNCTAHRILYTNNQP